MSPLPSEATKECVGTVERSCKTRQVAPLLVYKPLVVAADVVGINCAYILALVVCWKHLYAANEGISALLKFSPLISLVAVVALWLSDAYRNWFRQSAAHVVYAVVIGVALATIGTMALGLWIPALSLLRGTVLLACPIQAALIASCRLIDKRLYRHLCGIQHVVVVGGSQDWGLQVAEKFVRSLDGWYRIEKCVALKGMEAPYRDLETADAVILPADLREKEDLLQHCLARGKEVLVVPTLFELTLAGAEAWEVDDLLVLKIHPHRLNPAQEVVKRSIDLLGAVSIFLLTLPLFLFAFVAIPLTSKGPALFRQKRVGKSGAVFEVLKFRTMMCDAERSTGPVLATKSDPRVTKLGSLLRSTRIDELPQLFNVMKGDMSLIGPRPERPFFVEQFERELPSYALRYLVKPGLTGLAQVMGRYSTTARRKLRFDLLYIYNYSVLLDLRILVQTVRVVLHRDQAAGVSGDGEPLHKVRAATTHPGINIEPAVAKASQSSD